MAYDDLRPGDPHRLGEYRLVKRLGAGGMGRVFLGRSVSGLPVAVKLIHHDLAGDQAFRSRFAREVEAARAISGAFTAPVIDADPDADPPWLVTQFLTGLSLQEAIERHGPMPAPAVAALGAGLAEALVSIHQAGIVHRDLKPSNIMLCADGPRVIDFGVAHAVAAEAITRTGAIVGTPAYMAPEQATEGVCGPASDVFSLGCVLAYAATGRPPYGPGSAQIQLYRIVHEQPNLDAITDRPLHHLVRACLANDPAARPTARALLDHLARPPRGTTWLPAPVATDIHQRTIALPRRRFLTRLPVLLAIAFLLPALILGVTLYFWG
ncbi:serine/threonine protein kinase [Actinomadura logoneensis]|uniref:Serine/threonine protein kinase n=1 Tax=Actinomadura logoneensis TaxID=2293572 RepID=A0A372JR76_9ACTN|nr:serine/threonine-protein kinase [Actinomadura logoneensis]RFU42264.1 serine/threonine protein kinase [Actinomadura logoneensis]